MLGSSLSCRGHAAIVAISSAAVLMVVLAIRPAPVSGAARRGGPKGPSASGTVYIESNSAAADSNEILAFRYRDGVLSGAGRPAVPNRRERLARSEQLRGTRCRPGGDHEPGRTLLFAVNSSSDTIAVFHIQPAAGSCPSRGRRFHPTDARPRASDSPGSTLIVANKAQDGVRDLRQHAGPTTRASTCAPTGRSARRSPRSTVPPGSSPLQAYITPDRKVLISSEETGVFRAFRIGPGGTVTEGPNSPLRLAKAVFPGGRRVAERVAGRTRLKPAAEDPLRADREPLRDDRLPLE